MCHHTQLLYHILQIIYTSTKSVEIVSVALLLRERLSLVLQIFTIYVFVLRECCLCQVFNQMELNVYYMLGFKIVKLKCYWIYKGSMCIIEPQIKCLCYFRISSITHLKWVENDNMIIGIDFFKGNHRHKRCKET